MTDHLGDDELRAYARRALNGAALLAADDHLVSCRACEQRLQELPNGAAAALLRHLDDAVIEKLASGTLTEDDEATVELHTSLCARCRERWAFLRSDEQAGEGHRGTLVPFPRRASRAPLAAAIAATLVLLCGLGVVLVARRPASIPEQVATATHASTAAPPHVPAIDARPLPAPAPIAPEAPRTVVLLRDAHGAITASGTTTAGIPPGSWRTAVEAALRGGPVAFLSIADLATPGLVLRGGAETGDAVAVPEFPVATVVESDRPRFRWAAPPGGVVRVAVYTPDTQRVVQSGWMQATEWQAPASLPRGTTLVWQVESRTAEEAPDGRVSAPARFRVLSSAEAARLVTARATGSHLVLGTVAAELGLLDLAAAEFRRLRALNPDSPLAVALHEQALRAQRAAPTATKEAQKNG